MNESWMGIGRRLLAGAAVAAGLMGTAWGQAGGGTWPERPIRLIVGWPPGGGGDIVARLMAKYMSENLHASIIVENRPGAGGIVATQLVIHSPPDGYTLLFASDAELTIAPAVRKSVNYDPVKDLAPISLVSEGPFMIVANPKFPPNNLQELVEYAKQHPGAVNYGSFGLGTNGHMLGEQLKSMEHVDTVHIAYKGSAPALTDLIGGQIQYSFFSPMAVMQSIQQGQVKGIAMLAPQRLPGAEGIPTSAEEGAPGLIGGTRFGLLAPAGTPQAIVDKLQKSVAMTLALPEVQATFKTLYTVPIGNTPEQFRQFIVSETGKWRALGKKLDIELE